MIFYIIPNQLTTLFLSINLLTTLTFDSEIKSYMYGGANEDIHFQVTNTQRTLAIKPKQEQSFSNLLVITRDNKYYFDLKGSEKSPHTFIEIKDAVINHALVQKIKHTDYEILEGNSSLLFINKVPNEVLVNGIKVKNKEYFSKGIPILYEGKRILN